MKKSLVIIGFSSFLFLSSIALYGSGSFTNTSSSSSSGGGTWGSITGTLSGQTDLQTELDGKVNDTGNETVAGIKTLSSAPIMSSLTAQAMPYLNASKALANGGWTQADTTFLTTLTPTGSPNDGLLVDLGSTTAPTWGLRVTGGGKAASATIRAEASYSSATSSTNLNVSSTGTSSTGYIWGIRSTNTATCGGDTLGYNLASGYCAGSVTIAGGASDGLNVGAYGTAYGGLHNVGGGFQAVDAKAGAGNRTIGVHATASGENTAQMTGIFAKIRTANNSADLENEDPGFSGAAVFDNGNTGKDIIVGLSNGASVFHVRGGVGNAVVLGAGGTTTAVHEINGVITTENNGGTPTLAPTAAPVTGAPALWLKIKINGTAYIMPAWTAP